MNKTLSVEKPTCTGIIYRGEGKRGKKLDDIS
jgi:hypothetical protein